MRIEAAAILASSSHESYRRETVSESLRVAARSDPAVPRRNIPSLSGFQHSGRPTGPAASAAGKESAGSPPPTADEGVRSCPAEGQGPRYTKLKSLVERLVQAVTGKRVTIRLVYMRGSTVGHREAAGSAGNTRLPVLEFTRTRRVEEAEKTSYAVEGQVRTGDGRVISLRLYLVMERESVQTETVRVGAGGEPVDPLVVVLDGSYARLSDELRGFDLDMDGAEEMMRMPCGGCGLLVLDLDGDGVASDGGELTSTRTPTAGSTRRTRSSTTSASG